MKTHTLLISTLDVFLVISGCVCQSDVCGGGVGGQKVSGGSRPWLVGLQASVFRGYLFSGSLISEDWVLTVAHMFRSVSPSDLTVYLGSRGVSNPHETTRNVSEIIVHPNHSSVHHDIALLRLATPVSFSARIAPVCLASAGSVFPAGTRSLISGYSELPDDPQDVEIPVVDNGECGAEYRNTDAITDHMMCAGEERDGGNALCDVSVNCS